ncbi:MAG: apolipoprotein N-acyltransferase [Elusimicrobiota bacterium]|jgi:apolipoprotein N-acyltransferase|nr:apolipoprotein N-acyltransferase [Elusimicrobiota bacterium]
MNIKVLSKKNLLCVLTGLLTAFAYPKIDLFFLMWIAFVPLIYVVLNSSAKRSFFYGLFCGFIVNALSIYWLVPMLNFNTQSVITAIIVSSILWLYLALYWGVWSLGLNVFNKLFSSKWLLCLCGASLWVCLEYIRTYFLTGFPWLLIGYSQYKFPEIIQIAEFCGVYGISFVLIVCNILLYCWISSKNSKRFVFAALALIIVLSVFGAVRFDKFKFFGRQEYNVVIVQPSIDQYKKWDLQYQEDIMRSLNVYAPHAAKKDADLVIFPETVIPYVLSDDSSHFGEIEKMVKEIGAFSVLGAVFEDKDGLYFNSVFSFLPNERSYNGIHKKNHLVPFGEFVPLRKFLAKFLGVLNALGDFERSEDRQVFSNGRIYLGALICSENFFPDIARDFVLNGAKVLTNHTNDAWFFDTAAPYQHFIMNVFRAVENRKAVLISANSGISGIVEASGKIITMSPVFENGLISSSFLQNDFKSFYTRNGDVFAEFCFIILFIFLIIAAVIMFNERKINGSTTKKQFDK